jgi:hypothetical protein
MDEITIIFKSSLEERDTALMLFIEAVKRVYNEILDSVREGDEPDAMTLETAVFGLLESVKADGFKMTICQPTIGESFTAGKSLIWKVKIIPKPSWEITEEALLFNRANELDPTSGGR